LREAATTALTRVDPASEAEAFFEEVLRNVDRELEEENRGDAGAFGPE
jgi:hypothetical protein